MDAPQLPEVEIKKYHAWQRKVQERLPDISARVFALRNKMYMGCGFHYAMENQLGKVISIANNYTSLPSDWSTVVIDEVLVETLFNDVHKAEKSAEEWSKRNG